MDTQKENVTDAEKQETSPKKKFWTAHKAVCAVLLALIVICVCVYCYRDKPAKLVQTTDLDAANPEKGEIVDYRFAFNAAQDKELSPPEENGWRLILQALGPRALEQVNIAETVPWDEFPTNDKSKEWFNGQWTWLCEKFKLDPHERPTMLDRMSFWSYVCKYGLVGDEPEPDPDKPKGFYCENGERQPGKINDHDALETLGGKPWTAEDYPVAARWIEENADFYDVLAQAARSPKLGCWHYVPEPKEGGFIGTLLPDVQATREFARLLQIRACYRIGSGDLSGAIDDVETITLFGRATLDREPGFLVERLVGIACLGVAYAVPLLGNPDVAPTKEDLARIASLGASFCQRAQMESYAQRALSCESTFCRAGYADYLTLRRQGEPAWRYFDGTEGADSLSAKVFGWLFFDAPPVNDVKSFRIFEELCDSAFKAEDDNVAYSEIEKKASLCALLTQSPEKNSAILAASQLLPAVMAAKKAFYRAECVAKIGTITTALCAYRAEHGTLPPAFTVDENGKPLQSWRVLILPYLGDDAKALYDNLRLDEPWDSEFNSAFHAQIPDVFRCPSAKDLKEGETIYSVLLGDDGLFDESGTGKDFIETTKLPGRDVWNQFLVVERAEPVCWMKPDQELKIADFTADGKTDLAKFFGSRRHTGGINYSTPADAVRFISEAEPEAEVEARLRGLPLPKKEDVAEPTDDKAVAEEPVADAPLDNETADEEPTEEEPSVGEPEQP